MSDQLSNVALRFLGTRHDASDLSAADTRILSTGACVYVESANAIFALRKESTETADGVNIVAPVNSPGRWYRQTLSSLVNNDSSVPGETVSDALDSLLGVSSYSGATDLYLDPANGDDSNDGLTAITAWRTRERVAQALRSPLTVRSLTVTVHVLGDVPPDEPFFLDLDYFTEGAAGIIEFVGESPTVLRQEALTGWVAEDSATNVRSSITIAGVDWAAEGLVGLRVRRLSDNSVAWAQSVAGAADTVFINKPYRNGSSSPNWSVGQEVVVERLTSFGGNLRFHTRQDRAFLQVRFVDMTFGVPLTELDVRWVNFIKCHVNTGRVSGNRVAFFEGCRVSGFSCHSTGEELFFGGCWLDGILGDLRACQYVNMDDECSSTGPVKLNSTNFNCDSLGIWDWGTGPGLRLSFAATMSTAGRIFGSSNTAGSYGIQVQPGCHFEHGTLPTITGAEAFDIEVGGVQDVYANLPAAGQNPGNNNAWLVTKV